MTSVFQTWNNVKTKPFQAKSWLIYQKKPKIKTGTFYRNWTGSFWKIPQGSKFERFLFNIFHSIFLFVEKPDVCNFTDDDTLYSVLGLLNLNSHYIFTAEINQQECAKCHLQMLDIPLCCTFTKIRLLYIAKIRMLIKISFS